MIGCATDQPDISDVFGNDAELMLLFQESEAGEVLFSDLSQDETDVSSTNFFSEKRLGKNGLHGKQITVEDYEGEEAEAFLMLREGIGKSVNKTVQKREREGALEWVFVQNTENRSGISFDLCCDTLAVRADLVRTRIQYQLYVNKLPVDSIFPFLCTSLPDVFEIEARSAGGKTGEYLAAVVWGAPGIRADRLVGAAMEHYTKNEIVLTLNALEAQGLLAIADSLWFFTGRNPRQMKHGTHFSWAKIGGL